MNCRGLKAGLIGVVVVGLLLVGQALAGDGELNIGISSEPWDLDPATSTDIGSGYIIQNIYDPLIELDQNNEPTCEFALCKGWEWKNNMQTLILYLEEGVKFHDGRDLTASDVKYTLEWQLDPENAVPYARMIGPVVSIEVVDDYTLKTDFEFPFPAAIHQWAGAASTIGMVVPEGSHGERTEEKGVSGIAGTDLSRDPIGTGPFKLAEWVSGSHITLERNDNYWVDGVPAPEIDTVVFEFITDPATMVSAVISGSIEIVDSIHFRDYATLASAPNVRTARTPSALTEVLYINLSSPPFGISADQVGDEEAIEKAYNLRKFLFHAIDREEIADEVFYGMATVQYGPWYPESDWTSPKLRGEGLWKGITLHDPELAKDYLAKAGVADTGFDFRIICTRTQWFCDVATIIQEQLRPYGVDVEVIPLDKAALFDTMYESVDWDAIMEDYGFSNLLVMSWLYGGFYNNNWNHVHWHHAAPDLREDYHPSVPGHKEFADLYEKAEAEPNEQKKKELVWQMEEMVTELALRIDLMFIENLYVWRDSVKGYENGLNSTGNINLRFITEFTG